MPDNPFAILETPAAAEPIGAGWFAGIGEFLLNGAALAVNGEPHRFLEVEAYYNGPSHPDPFTHGDPIQKTCQRWYFHRDGDEYRGGTFKGLDISFGPPDAFGGILIRSLETPAGEVINGSCLCVDYLLRRTNAESVAALDAIIDGRPIGEIESPLHIRPLDASAERREIFATARVGLSLKRARKFPTMPAYMMRPYRYLSRPTTIKKGRPHLVMALHRAGKSRDEIRHISGGTTTSIAEYITAYDAGKSGTDTLDRFLGQSLSTEQFCHAHGIWDRQFADV